MSRADSVLSSPSMFNFFLHVFFSLELPCCILITPSPVAFLYEKISHLPLSFPFPYIIHLSLRTPFVPSPCSHVPSYQPTISHIHIYTDSCKPFFLSSPSFTITTLGKQANALYNSFHILLLIREKRWKVETLCCIFLRHSAWRMRQKARNML